MVKIINIKEMQPVICLQSCMISKSPVTLSSLKPSNLNLRLVLYGDNIFRMPPKNATIRFQIRVYISL